MKPETGVLGRTMSCAASRSFRAALISIRLAFFLGMGRVWLTFQPDCAHHSPTSLLEPGKRCPYELSKRMHFSFVRSPAAAHMPGKHIKATTPTTRFIVSDILPWLPRLGSM
jgi:hypothetical protein